MEFHTAAQLLNFKFTDNIKVSDLYKNYWKCGDTWCLDIPQKPNLCETKSSLKILKDLYGIWYVASQLGDFSDQALDEFKVLKQHSKWFKTFQKNLRNWLNDSSQATGLSWKHKTLLLGYESLILKKL